MSDERRISAGTALRTAALLVSFVIELLAAANFVLGMPRASAFYHDIELAGGGANDTIRLMLSVVRWEKGPVSLSPAPAPSALSPFRPPALPPFLRQRSWEPCLAASRGEGSRGK